MNKSDNLAVLFTGAKVYAPEYRGIRDILVCGGRIISIGENLASGLLKASSSALSLADSDTDTASVIPGLRVIDCRGKILIPGLVDEHVHVTGGGGECGFSSRVPELTMQQLVSAGVTTVVGVLGTDSITRNMQSLLAKVKALKEQGMSAWCLTGAYHIEGPTITGSVSNDVCFIEEILGVKVAINDHRCAMPTTQELIRLAANVRLASLTANKPGVVHMHTGKGKNGFRIIFNALEQSDLPIRHFRPTHCGGNLEDAIRFGQMGGYIDFTASEEYRKTVADIMKASQTVPFDHITMSSDSGGSLPIWNERKEMIGMGVGTPDTLLPVIRGLRDEENMPLEKALTLVTLNPADSLGFARKGRISEGADADFVFVDADLNVQEVYCMGQKVF